MAQQQTVWGMGGSGWRATGAVTSGAGSLMAIQGTLDAGKAAKANAENQSWGIRRNAKGEALDKTTQANRLRGDATAALIAYSKEKALRADKVERSAAGTLSAYAKNGVSLDSDSVRAVHEYEATIAKEQENLLKDETFRQVNNANRTATDLGLSAEAGVSNANLEAGFVLLEGRRRLDASRYEAVGQAFTGVSSLASIFAR